MSSNKYFYQGTQLTSIFSNVGAAPISTITSSYSYFPPIAQASSQNSVGVLQNIDYSISGTAITSTTPIIVSYQDFNTTSNITLPSWCNSIAATITTASGAQGAQGADGAQGAQGAQGPAGPSGIGGYPVQVAIGINCAFDSPNNCNYQYQTYAAGPGGPGAPGGVGGLGGPGGEGGPGGPGGEGVTINTSKYTFGSGANLSVTFDASVSLLNNSLSSFLFFKKLGLALCRIRSKSLIIS